MTILPIVERELRVASRRRGTYWMRVFAALVALVLLGFVMVVLVREAVPSAAHGRVLFRALVGFAFAYCLFVGARVTADCMSEEKREGTLGLLFLTDLKGYDVVLGKLAASSLNSVYGLLAILPVIALSVQLGGVTAAELWRSALVLLNTLLLSLAAGIFVSTLSLNERKAMFATVFVALLAALGPFLIGYILAEYFPAIFDRPEVIWRVLMCSPVYAFGYLATQGVGGALPFPASSFWWSVILTHATTWVFLVSASVILPRIWQAGVSSARLTWYRVWTERLTFGAAAERNQLRARLLDVNPFLWLAGRERWKPHYVWVYLGTVAALWIWGWFNYRHIMFDRDALVPTVLLTQCVLKIWVVSEAGARLAEDRHSGALELLLSTPLSERDILRGQWLALRRQFMRPVLLMLVIEFFVLIRTFPLELVFANLAMLIADCLALGWVSMWLGLKARNTTRAIIGTVMRVLVLPWIAWYAVGMSAYLLYPATGRGRFDPSLSVQVWLWFAIGMLANVIFGWIWARRRLLADFREIAVQGRQPRKKGWFKGIVARQDAPPLGATLSTN